MVNISGIVQGYIQQKEELSLLTSEIESLKLELVRYKAASQLPF
jgi:hypothetical protein